MFFVDSHCHLDFEKLSKISSVDYSPENIINRAAQALVKYLLVIGTELSDIKKIRDIANAYPNVFRSVGIHPNESKRHLNEYSENEIADLIINESKLDRTIAIGEIGLDYFYGYDQKEEQLKIFNLQLELAKTTGLPISVHSRDAEDDIINTLKRYDVRGTIHCFSGSKEYAFKALDLGFYISASGIATFKKSVPLQETLKLVPKDRLLIETDAPFLAPVPLRGKINEPAFVVHTARKLAELLNVSLEEVANFSSENFFNLFSRAKKD